MKDFKILPMYILVTCVMLLSCIVPQGASAAPITASTSATVVNVTEFPFNSIDITQWAGPWPNDPDHVIPAPGGQEVYLNNVHFTATHMSWETTPFYTPYPTFPNTVNSMVAAVWSTDKGKTFKLGSWDYLSASTHAKGIEGGMPDCWMGTMVHSICDRKAGECNGRNRSNLYFTEYPSGNASCWGTVK